MINLNDMRLDYTEADPLDSNSLMSNPFQQFEKWFNEARQQNVPEPNAVVLSTASKDGKVTSRVMLLKFFDENGFVFFTNYESQKAKQILENPRGCLLFWWQPCHRQIRVSGTIHKLDGQHSDDYFQHRDRASQFAALASNQSHPLASRAELEEKFQQLQKQYSHDEVIPRPVCWGGYVLVPDEIEFWQGRGHRLHDRFLYQRQRDDKWKVSRLSP